jgi:cytoskeletal protein CcmA (bactofilin family)
MFSKGSGSKTPDVPTPSAAPVEPIRSSMPKGIAVPSIISADLKIVGNMTSSGDIQVDGTVEGDISSRTLTVGEEAHIDGSIVAESVRVCGHVSGEVKATAVILAKTGRVQGDIAHQTLSIEAGAFIEGNIRRLESEPLSGGARVSVIKPASDEKFALSSS